MLNDSFKALGDHEMSPGATSQTMCRMSTITATALSLCMVWTTAALADPAPQAAVSPVAKPDVVTIPMMKPGAAQSPEAPHKASPEDRAMAKRLDPLARAAFWAKEIQVDGRDAQAGVGLSQALRTLGNFEEALEAAQRVLVVDPKNVDALLEVARSQIGRGQGFYAIEPARQAQGLAPQDWRPVTLLAVAYEQAQRSDEAEATHRQALVLAPDNPTVMTNYALFLAGHGESAKAESLLRTAATKPGAEIAVRQNLALILGLEGRLDEAERLARQDLPPEIVESNLAYLRNATAAGQVRSWDTVRQGQ